MDPDDTKDLERYLRDKGKAKAKGRLTEVAQLCNCIGEIYSKYERYEEAIEEHLEEKLMSEAIPDRIGEAVACRLIGECYCALSQYKEALEQQKMHLTLARECQNDLEEQRAWATIGRTYLCQTESRNVMESSLANKRAERAFFRALEACEKVKASVTPTEYMAMKGRLFLNIGLVYDNRGDLKQSADAMKKALMIAEKYKLDNELHMCYSSLAAMYQNGRKYTEAIRSYEMALKFARKLHDKVKENDLLINKSLSHIAIGDFLEAKHCLKKAHKLKLDRNIGTRKLRKLFRNVTKVQEATADLESTDDEAKICQLHETIADGLVESGNCKEAITSYMKVQNYNHLLTPNKRAAIYTSIAQTYADDKQYTSAIFYHKKELELQKENPEQCCRTNLNMAELEELNGSKYSVVCKIYMEAFEQAKKAKHAKLMIQTLKSLIELQKLCQQQSHLERSQKTLTAVRTKYGVEEDTEESQEDDDTDKDSEGTGDMSLSDLTVSEETDEDMDEGDNSAVPRRKKSNFTRTNEKGETPLHRACINGNLKKVKALIAEGHPLNPRDYCGWLPLHEASNHGYAEVVELLLSNGAWINDRGGERCGGVTPLIDAANCGNLDVVQVFLNHGANVHAKDDDGNTALDCLQGWYNRAMKVLEAQDVLEYKKTQRLLLDRIGRNRPSSKAVQEKSRLTLCKSADVAAVKRSAGTHNATPPLRTRLPDLVDLDDDVDDNDDDNVPQRNTSATVKARLSELRQKRMSKKPRRSSIEKRRADRALSSNSDSSDLENFLPPPPPPLDTIRIESDNATEVYQTTIRSLRKPAQSRVEPNSSHGETIHSDPIKAPYIEGAIDVEDDWLIYDVEMPRGKKRSADVNRIFTTSHTRTTTSAGSKRRRMNDKTPPEETLSESDVNNSCHSDEINSKCSSRFDVINSKSSGHWDVLNSENSRSKNSDALNLKNASHGGNKGLKAGERISKNTVNLVAEQTSKIGHSGNNSRTSIDESDCHIMSSWDKTEKPAPTSDEELWGPDEDDYLYESELLCDSFTAANDNQVSVNGMEASAKDHGSLSSLKELDTQNKKSDAHGSRDLSHSKVETMKTAASVETKNQETATGLSSSCAVPASTDAQPVSRTIKFSVKVKLEDKTFLVPVFAGDENKSTAWLAQQVSDRYFGSFFIYPMVTFRSPDGMLIGSSDPISILGDGISELHAKVHTWSRRSAVERYEAACKTFNEDSNMAVKSAMRKVDESKVLDLSHLNLNVNQLFPVFQALEGGSDVTELNFTGNRLTNLSLDSLTSLLAKLSSLSNLILESNDISAEGLQVFASFIQSSSNLQHLMSLSLSYNGLTDKAEPSLRLLLKSLPSLSTLKLTGCCFTPEVFTPSFLETFSGCSLECLVVSENRLTKKCLKSLLEKTQAERLRHLDFSQCLEEEANSISIELLLEPVATHEYCRLQTLSLAGCHLSREDVLAVIRLPIKIPSLEELTISLNSNITHTSLQKLLSLSAGKACQLQRLAAKGCGVRSPLSEEFMEALKGKLHTDVPLSSFVFTCRALTATESDSLQSIWREHWLNLAKVKVSGMIVHLSTESYMKDI